MHLLIYFIFFTRRSKSHNDNFSPYWLHPGDAQDLQGYPAMKAPLLNRRGHDKAAEKEKISFKKVLRAHFLGRKNSQCRKKADRQHGSDRQWKSLRAPKCGHQQHNIQTFSFLWRRKKNNKKNILYGKVCHFYTVFILNYMV